MLRSKFDDCDNYGGDDSDDGDVGDDGDDGDEDCAQNSHYLLSAAAPSTNQGFGKGLLMMMTVMIVMLTMMLTMMMTALMTAMITNIKIAFQFLIIISCTSFPANQAFGKRRNRCLDRELRLAE